jgi:uncharacterized membrane protein YcgQ (UPF0703/DUF1980 family)
MHNFLYSTIVSYHAPLHVSSVTALILRRTLYIYICIYIYIYIYIYAVSGFLTLCVLPYMAQIKGGLSNTSLFHYYRMTSAVVMLKCLGVKTLAIFEDCTMSNACGMSHIASFFGKFL